MYMFSPSQALMVTGGMDSTVLLYWFKKNNPQPIIVNYGYASFARDVNNLNYHIDKLGLKPLVVIDIEFKDWQKQQGLFTKNYTPKENNPLGDWNDLRYKDFFVEGRNMIMMSYVLAYCSAHKIDELCTGYLYEEEEWCNRRTYKLMTGDNSPQFVDMMNLMSTVGFSHQVRIRAPYYELKYSKMDVYNMGVDLGVDFSKTCSCYFDPVCGVCDNCLLRKQIGVDNG